MDDSRLTRALRQGPPFRTHYATQDLTLARESVAWRPLTASSPLALAMIAGLLVGLLTAGALILGGLRNRDLRPVIRVDHGLVFARGGQLLRIDPNLGTEVALGPGSEPISWSPDRSRIVFTLGNETWIMASDGSGRRLLGPGAGRVAWSADGTRLLRAYVQFQVLPIDGGRALDLRMSPWKDSGNGSWAPDGSQVAVVSEGKLFTVHLGAAGVQSTRALAYGRNPWLVRWSPDGSTIAYDASDGIRLVRPDGSGDHELIGVVPFPVALAWAPDSQHLAYVQGSSAYVVDTATGASRRVFSAQDGRQPVSVVWSPDGRQLGVTIAKAFNADDTAASLWTVNSDGTNRQLVVDHMDWTLDAGPDW